MILCAPQGRIPMALSLKLKQVCYRIFDRLAVITPKHIGYLSKPVIPDNREQAPICQSLITPTPYHKQNQPFTERPALQCCPLEDTSEKSIHLMSKKPLKMIQGDLNQGSIMLHHLKIDCLDTDSSQVWHFNVKVINHSKKLPLLQQVLTKKQPSFPIPYSCKPLMTSQFQFYSFLHVIIRNNPTTK